MSQLLRRNLIAALAPQGAPDIDIIVSDRVGGALAGIQVKARRGGGSGKGAGWRMSAKHETIVRGSLFYVFVDYGGDEKTKEECWIIPSAVVAEAVTTSHKAWMDKPDRHGLPHKENEMRLLLPAYSWVKDARFALGWMRPYHERWDLISS